MTTPLSQPGEFGLIERIRRRFGFAAEDITGIGDDAAVVVLSEELAEVITTDMFMEGVHYDFSYVPLHLLGWKVVSATLSDVAAMRARPAFFLLSMALGNRFTVEGVDAVMDGIEAACKYYGASTIGGDTVTTLRGSAFHGVGIGREVPSRITYRKGARPGDLICVSGNLGAAFLGLHVLEREKEVLKETHGVAPHLDKYRYLLERYLRPVARFDVVKALNDNDVRTTAMIDISDGLSSDLLHVLVQSQVGCDIYEDRLPIDPLTFKTALEFNMAPATCALHGGEDYELLFTVPADEAATVNRLADVTVIGEVVQDPRHRMFHTTGGQPQSLTAQGWDSFLGRPADGQ